MVNQRGIPASKAIGGMFGALIGDAVGVPYESKSPSQLHSIDAIDMIPPLGFNRSWPNIEPGTYSDDGAQMLCLLDHLLDDPFFSPVTFKEILRSWLTVGYMSVHHNTFDVGNQTKLALNTDDTESLNRLDLNGNGSLMRCLPVGLYYATEADVAQVAWAQSGVTHPHQISRLCCSIYCLMVFHMLRDVDPYEAYDLAVQYVNNNFPACDRTFLRFIEDFGQDKCRGTGYVVDCLWSSIRAVTSTSSYELAIRQAISYGNDTDTTACVTGGLAGVRWGIKNIPSKWVNLLKGRDWIDPLVKRLIANK